MNLRKFKKELKREYQDTFKNKKQKCVFTFKLRHAFAVIILLFGFFLIGDHIVISAHNNKIREYNNKIIEDTKELYTLNTTSFIKIESLEELNTLRKNKEYKTSILSSFFNSFTLKNAIKEDGMDFGVDVEEDLAPDAPEQTGDSMNTGNSVINTNVQIKGIDEDDYVKCDGKYIYSINNGRFFIFDLKGNLIVNERLENSLYSMYVNNNDIVLLGYSFTSFYEFDGEKITLINTFQYNQCIESRLTENNLYLVYYNKFDENTVCEEGIYYDGISYTERLYTILKYNLNTNEYLYINNLNSGQVKLHMSKNHLYLATSVGTQDDNGYYCTITAISVFDYNLNPIGVFKVRGTILNQFSMDEYENYFRVVSTDTTAQAERLNAISIFDLNSKELVGYLNEGIGLGRQIVKSVRFEGTTCYVVTYLNTDPLYEIDLTDPTKPTIISEYQAPGYSSYLHTFKVNGEEYVFGIGYCDDMMTRKISVYKNGDETIQIGDDFLVSEYYNPSMSNVLLLKNLNYESLNNHKALFIYQKEDLLYIGLRLDAAEYYFFKIDVNSTDVISVYDTIEFEIGDGKSRCYLIDGKIYITNYDKLYIAEWDSLGK